MVAGRFQVLHKDSNLDVDYDTDDGFEVFKSQLFSPTSIPPEEQKIFGGEDDHPVWNDEDLVSISGKLRLVSVNESSSSNVECINEQEAEAQSNSVKVDGTDLLKSDEELAGLLQELKLHIKTVLKYEDGESQEAARKTVPIEELKEKALVSLAKEGNFEPSKIEQDHAFLLQLLFWFKQSFRLVDSPSCHDCGNQTVSQGMADALPSEIRYEAWMVELYRCTSCHKTTRFPCYNDPIKLVETRKGRCGEWANCFTLYCRAFGYDSRLVLDFTDHLWTESYSQYLARWMHLDPCEGVYDNPLLYEKGWNKKLNYVIAIAKDGIYDVTKRYTKKWHKVLSRRTLIVESALSALLSDMTKELRGDFASQLLSVIEDRDLKESQQLERSLHAEDDTSLSVPRGRSGDEEWHKSRLEIGSNRNSSFSSSSCPVRLCVDEHVTRIYNAFRPVLDEFVREGLTKSEAIEVLVICKGIFLDLSNSPFRTRRTTANSFLNNPKCQKSLPSFDELLSALSLGRNVSTDRQIEICLAGDPVKCSLALPVVLDALDDMVCNLNKCENFGKDYSVLPLLKLNRIHSGSVVASAEKMPFGIATSAFDGTQNGKNRMVQEAEAADSPIFLRNLTLKLSLIYKNGKPSKQEPYASTGCWIVYTTCNDKMYELAAYELMSANDAPERDPMDWILEGSNDGGINWQVLDQQSSQIFEDRFQRRTYMVTSTSFPSNVFRFRFLAVRDIQSTSRLQIGSIDLYART